MATHSSIPAWRTPMDRGAWRVTDQVVAKSWTRLSDKAQQSTCVCMAESLSCPSETTAAWLTGYAPCKIKGFFKKDNKNSHYLKLRLNFTIRRGGRFFF